MNVSKRTWIVFGIAIIAILAAFASLYFEKESEIKTLENIGPDEPEEKPLRVVKSKKTDEVKTDLIPENNGNGQK